MAAVPAGYKLSKGILVRDSDRSQGVHLLVGTAAIGTVALGAGSAVVGSLAASELHIGEVGVFTKRIADSFARPADTTAYTINDVIGATVSDTGTTALRGLSLARAVGRGVVLRHFGVTFDKTDFLPTLRVHLFTVAAPTTALVGDNLALVEYDANVAQDLGAFDLPAHVLRDSGNDFTIAFRDDLDLLLEPADADSNIYYRLQIIAGTSITPSSGMTVRVNAAAVSS